MPNSKSTTTPANGIDLNGMQCPKVFSSDLVTVNMPAKDVLGQKYASFAKNLAENHRSEKQLNNQYIKNLPANGGGGGGVGPATGTGAGVGHNAGYCNIPSNAALFKQQNNSSDTPPRGKAGFETAELLTKVNNDRYDRYPKPGTYTYGGLQIYPMNGVNTDINNGVERSLSHAELEDMLKICTEYADRQQQQQQQQQHSSHNVSSGSGSITSSPIVQNRIKTNGSLPRDKKSPFQTGSNNSGSNLANPSTSGSSTGYENVRLLGANRIEINGQLHVGGGGSAGTVGGAGGSGSVSTNATPKSSYENVVVGKYVPQSPRTKIRTNCMSPKKDASFGGAFSLASPTTTQPTSAAPSLTGKPKPPLAPKPPAPNQQRDYEQLFKSFERKQQLEESHRSKRANKNINNLTLNLNRCNDTNTASPKLSKKPAPAPRTINGAAAAPIPVPAPDQATLQRQRREVSGRLKQLKQELAEMPAPTQDVNGESQNGEATTDTESTTRLPTPTLLDQLYALRSRTHRLEAQRNSTRVMEENQQAKLKQFIEMRQDQMKKLRAMLKQNPNSACLKEELEHVSDLLESDRKTFEDLEFQYFEEESEYHACHEELKRQEKRLTLETEISELTQQLATLHLQLGVVDVDTPPASPHNSPLATNLGNGVMSQSLFGSAELLCPKLRTNDDLMSKSVNENMFYNHKIELPTTATATVTATSTPKRPPLQVFETNLGTDGGGSCEQISFNLSLRSDCFEVNPLERRVPSQDDIDRSCKVANDAPISTTQGACTKIFDSIKEIERNRKLLLAQQGHQVIEHERQKICDLKKKSHDEARTQYLLYTLSGQSSSSSASSSPPTPPTQQQKLQQQQQQQLQHQSMQHAPMTANGGQDAKLFEKVELQKLNVEEPQQQQQKTHDKENDGGSDSSSPNSNSNNNSSSKRDSNAQRHSQPELEHHVVTVSGAPPARSPRPLSEANNCEAIEAPKFVAQNGELLMQQSAADSKRASSNSQDTTSAGSGSSSAGGGGGGSDRKRPLPKHQRPLTRYLPNYSLDLNLRDHIETAGHQIDLCPHVFVDAHSCRGYLHKLGATFHAWSRRWFVLDRQRSALIYYSDKSERKPRGGAYFSTIDEVYLDHLNASKSGRPHCTFIVKTKKRSYNLQAASDAAARIWIDAIITGAQGNLDY
ncbi:pleckstrin homology-like domain family B member 1 isoform X1 [Scaptodrosophila lebanonensis]|uniref:Pleckstrin homology-like domain family B member 1 isoform X1 n=1 Tax=Drosophila lebanonensis TaxID=7225 RepID=A0A6J2TUA2_DROLE|nr:pleckstrin homology-like domain family B member 1 isoform X1 [Scaptodrosophila lebanonensis]